MSDKTRNEWQIVLREKKGLLFIMSFTNPYREPFLNYLLIILTIYLLFLLSTYI
jgi:hypothetical protein